MVNSIVVCRFTLLTLLGKPAVIGSPNASLTAWFVFTLAMTASRHLVASPTPKYMQPPHAPQQRSTIKPPMMSTIMIVLMPDFCGGGPDGGLLRGCDIAVVPVTKDYISVESAG